MSETEKKIMLEVVSPAEILFSGEVDSLVVNAAKGKMGVLHDHAPLAAVLKPGLIKFRVSGKEISYKTSDGFLEIGENRIRVIVESAEALK